MALDLGKLAKNLDKALKNITQEEIDKYFPPDTRPKGWLSIEEHLPYWLAKDFDKGFSVYKVKDKDGKEYETMVTDHHIWYYMAKDVGVTHWWNE